MKIHIDIRTLSFMKIDANVLGIVLGVEQKEAKFKFSTKANRKYKCSFYYKSYSDEKSMLASGVFCQAMYILKNVQVKYAQSNEKKICTNVSNVLPIQSFFEYPIN